jgi:DNA-binding transcriptional regulator YiaG
MHGRRENYHYSECGLSSVFLRNIVVFHCDCGAVVPVIPAAARLHRQIVLDILKKPTLLSAEEIRFLRKMANFNSTELAGVMGVSPVTVTRWEKESFPIGKENDRVLRLICFVGMLQDAIHSQDEGKKTIHAFAVWAKAIADLSIKTLLENIEDRIEGSTQVTVDPTILAEYGTGEDELTMAGSAFPLQ